MLNELFGKFDQIAKVSLPAMSPPPLLQWGDSRSPSCGVPGCPGPSAVRGGGGSLGGSLAFSQQTLADALEGGGGVVAEVARILSPRT